MRVDVHAHYVPPRILEVLERDAAPYGVQVQNAEGGGRCLHFGYGVTLRPFLPHLLDLDERWRFMDAQGVDRQLLSVWTDLCGYGLESAVAARWHRLLNETLTEVVQRHPQRPPRLAETRWTSANLPRNPSAQAGKTVCAFPAARQRLPSPRGR